MSNIKAVILAAGLGKRIKSVSQDIPKSLLKLDNNISFIERQIICLKRNKINKIAIVVGYNKEYFYNIIHKKYRDIYFIENTTQDINLSGSLDSFKYAVDSDFNPLDGKSHTLLMDADIVYENNLIKYLKENILKNERRSKINNILISPNIKDDDKEEVRVYIKDDLPCFLGKALFKFLDKNIYKCIGEAVGIVHFSFNYHNLIKDLIDWLINYGPAKKKTEHEELSQWLMHLKLMQSLILPKDCLFMEVDNEEEYNYMRNNFYLKILEKDKQ